MAFGLSQSARTLQRQLSGHSGQAFLVAEDASADTGFRSTNLTSIAIRHQLTPFALTVASERGREWTSSRQPSLDRSDYYAFSVTLDGRSNRLRYGLGITQLSESRTILGGRFSPTLLSGGAHSTFVDGALQFDLARGLQAEASYRRGWTTIATNGGLVRNGRLASEAFAGSIARTSLFGIDDHLAVRVSQPLRVRSGGFRLYVPVSYNYATGTALYGNQFMGATPSGRELDYEITYGFGLFGGQIDFNAFTRVDPGHLESMKRDNGGAIRFKVGL